LRFALFNDISLIKKKDCLRPILESQDMNVLVGLACIKM